MHQQTTTLQRSTTVPSTLGVSKRSSSTANLGRKGSATHYAGQLAGGQHFSTMFSLYVKGIHECCQLLAKGIQSYGTGKGYVMSKHKCTWPQTKRKKQTCYMYSLRHAGGREPSAVACVLTQQLRRSDMQLKAIRMRQD